MRECHPRLVSSVIMVGPLDASRNSSPHPQPPISRLLARLGLLPRPCAPLNGANLPSPATDVLHQQGTSTLEIDQGLPTDPDVLCELLVELVSHLQPLLSGDCEWLKEGAIEVTDDRPVAAGEVANIFVGMKGNHKVAIKHYRFYSTSDYLPTYIVGVLGYLS